MSHRRNPGSTILLCEVVGFGGIIVLSWANELASLPRLLFGADHRPNWPECLMETVITIAVAIPVLWFTKRLSDRLHYLEGFLRVCAWCRKLHHEGDWVAVEEFFERGFATQTSHAICPDCVKGLEAETRAAAEAAT